MEERFRGADCVDKLIELVKGIDDIKHLVKNLQKEKLKGNEEEPLFHSLCTVLNLN